jgi:hypothetical protein
MKRFLSSLFIALFAVALVPSLTGVAGAKTSCPKGETYVKPYTKTDGTKVSGYCKSSGTAMASPAAMKSMAPAAMKPAASTMKSATAAATSKPASMKGAESMKPATMGTAPTAAGTCPAGKTYVHGYTKSNGTKVAAYCRNKPSK